MFLDRVLNHDFLDKVGCCLIGIDDFLDFYLIILDKNVLSLFFLILKNPIKNYQISIKEIKIIKRLSLHPNKY